MGEGSEPHSEAVPPDRNKAMGTKNLRTVIA